MKTIVRLAALLFLLSSLPALGTSPRHIPEHFQGEWNRRPADCGTGRNDSRLRIGDDWIAFYESRGEIQVFATQGEREIALIVELQGEEDRWTSFRHFRLSEDGERLTDITYGADFERRRCAVDPPGSSNH